MNNKDLVATIREGFKNKRLMQSMFDEQSGFTGNCPHIPMRNKLGGFDVAVCITVTSNDFLYSSDITATSANVSFIIELINCSYIHNSGFAWNKETGKYKVKSGYFEPSIIVMNKDVALNGDAACEIYVHGLNEGEDKTLSNEIALSIIEATPRADFLDMLSTIADCVFIESQNT